MKMGFGNFAPKEVFPNPSVAWITYRFGSPAPPVLIADKSTIGTLSDAPLVAVGTACREDDPLGVCGSILCFLQC